jgi:oxygen-independent coproporphyrinogen III oxidase
MLKLLGRGHTEKQTVKAVDNLQKAGISNISIDLMYDLPTLNEKIWEETLNQALELPLTHVSLYNLSFEPKTVFQRKAEVLKPLLPSEEESLRMYEMMLKKLPEKKIYPYEISAFCKEGYYSKHNTGYWLARQFLGIGPSAFSYLGKSRFQNTLNLKSYFNDLEQGKKPVDFKESLEDDHARRELFLVQLRLRQGVPLEHFQTRHGALSLGFKEKLKALALQDLLTLSSSLCVLSEKGSLLYDSIASELI